MRGKLSLLLLGLFLSIGSFAQSFTPSFEKEFLAQMFAAVSGLFERRFSQNGNFLQYV